MGRRKDIRLKNSFVEIRARRIHVVFENKGDMKHPPKPVDQLEMLGNISGKQREELEKSLRKMEVDIEIELPAAKPTEQDVSSAIHAVFFMPGDSMIEAVPMYWRGYFATLGGQPFNPPSTAGPVSRMVGKNMSPPRAITQPDPEYSDEARRAKYQGTGVVWLVVDETGSPRDLQIQRPLGLGLDEKAIAAISGWKFEPAQKDGKPVAVMINVEVAFRLY
jgi:TonB family protein